MASLQSWAMDVGLGGKVRDVLVTQDYTCGIWPLSEVVSTTARDLTDLRNHGAYSGTGLTRGVSVDLPEGGLGTTFDGTSGYVTVADDALSGGRNLSLAGGRMEISFFIKTTTNDATLRCIVHKQATDSSGNGYHVALQNGAIEFYLKRAGVGVFSFQRGAVADGNWHAVVCYYDPNSNLEARIYIDGVLSGAAVAASTEANYVATPLEIGRFADGAGYFSGTLAYVMVGREGSETLPARLQAPRSWTSIKDDILTRDSVVYAYGIQSSRPWDLVATTGTLTFTLNNSATNSAGLVGRYSIGHTNCLSGFTVGIPVRWTLTYDGTTYERFRGHLIQAAVQPGTKLSRGVNVVCADWMDRAAVDFYGEAATQESKASGLVMGVLIDQASFPPPGVSLPTSSTSLTYALDAGQSDRDPILSEAQRIAQSEFGYFYVRRQGTVGGVPTFVPRFSRQTTGTFAATFDDSMVGLQVDANQTDIVNSVRMRVYPPAIDGAATTVLFGLRADSTNRHVIAPGETLILNGPYTDPSNPTARVGGTSMVTPVATTDYTANTAADGSGTNMTSSLSVDVSAGANLIRAYITNTSLTTLVYLTKFQVRGKGLYRYEAIENVLQDAGSIRQHGLRELTVDMPYAGSLTAATLVADEILALYAQPVTRPTGMQFVANRSTAQMTAALSLDIGDRVAIAETVSGVVNGTGQFINGVTLALEANDILRCSWAVTSGWPDGLIANYAGPSGLSGQVNLDRATLTLTVGGDYTFTFSRTGDTISLTGAGGGGGGGGGNDGGGGGGGGGAVQHSGISHVISTTSYTGKVGAAGAGGNAGSAGTAGGTTEFRIPASTILLQLGGGGAGGASGGAAGTGGAVGTGSGNVAGGAGGAGTAPSGGFNNGTTNTGSTGGGGSGGAFGNSNDGSAGGTGGTGHDQVGGAGGNAGTADGGNTDGGHASGRGGLKATGSTVQKLGGGGGGGGGWLASGAHFGGGGGGGGGSDTGLSGAGSGGAGGGGVLVIAKV